MVFTQIHIYSLDSIIKGIVKLEIDKTRLVDRLGYSGLLRDAQGNF